VTYLPDTAFSVREARKALIDADLVDCMVALPRQLFYNTQIPTCLWFLTRGKSGGKFRKREGKLYLLMRGSWGY
jgi:type I restriction-modification system DNA methylase subunit